MWKLPIKNIAIEEDPKPPPHTRQDVLNKWEYVGIIQIKPTLPGTNYSAIQVSSNYTKNRWWKATGNQRNLIKQARTSAKTYGLGKRSYTASVNHWQDANEKVMYMSWKGSMSIVAVVRYNQLKSQKSQKFKIEKYAETRSYDWNWTL